MHARQLMPTNVYIITRKESRRPTPQEQLQQQQTNPSPPWPEAPETIPVPTWAEAQAQLPEAKEAEAEALLEEAEADQAAAEAAEAAAAALLAQDGIAEGLWRDPPNSTSG